LVFSGIVQLGSGVCEQIERWELLPSERNHVISGFLWHMADKELVEKGEACLGVWEHAEELRYPHVHLQELCRGWL
jgi:hypothetical protein